VEDDDAEPLVARYLEAFARANGPEVKPPIIKQRAGWFSFYHNGTISKAYRRIQLFEMTKELEKRAAIAARHRTGE
jgi:hypothetical protein